VFDAWRELHGGIGVAAHWLEVEALLADLGIDVHAEMPEPKRRIATFKRR
jgi:hypothetical protein